MRNSVRETETISMVRECVDKYQVTNQPAGGIDIRISVPKRFADLWLLKLSALRASRSEIEDHGPL